MNERLHTNAAALAIIRGEEGCRLAAYPDPATGGEPWTIGYGHTRDVHPGQTITQHQAEVIFASDVEEHEAQVRHWVTVPLSENQFSALVSFAFNEGIGTLARSHLLLFLNSGDTEAAAAEFPKYKFAAGKVLNGLIKRRAEERALFETP